MKKKLLIAALGFIAVGSFATGIAKHARRHHQHKSHMMNKVAQVCVDAARRSEVGPKRIHPAAYQPPVQQVPTYVPYYIPMPYGVAAPAQQVNPQALAPEVPSNQKASTSANAQNTP